MYYLYNKDDKIQVLNEAIRVTKTNGKILVAYFMNESAIIQYAFMSGNIKQLLENKMITDDWHCISNPKDLFEMIRLEEIDELNKIVNIKRNKIIATDGPTNYFRNIIDSFDEETFNEFINYYLNTCERMNLIGASNHSLDILTK